MDAPADDEPGEHQHDEDAGVVDDVGVVRPLSTAERAIGSERKRSISPLSCRRPSRRRVIDAKATSGRRSRASGTRGRSRRGSGIAPPKTKANSSTNMIDWRIAKIASSGIRGTRFRLRQATTRPSRGGLRRGVTRSPSLPRLGLVGRRRGRVAGQREEDVVEGRPAQARCRRRRCPRRRAGGRPRRAAGRRRRAANVSRPRVLVDRAGSVGSEQRDRRASTSSRVRTTTSIRSPPTCAFSSSAVPRAMIRPWSMTAIRRRARRPPRGTGS